MDQISEAFTKASGANDSGVMETLILSMGNVGVSVSRDSTPLVVISLFNCFVTQDKCLASLAADQIQSIARAQKMSYHSLFTTNKSQICHMMVQKVLRSLEEEGSDYQSVTDEFISIAKLFEFPDVKAYLTVSQNVQLFLFLFIMLYCITEIGMERKESEIGTGNGIHCQNGREFRLIDSFEIIYKGFMKYTFTFHILIFNFCLDFFLSETFSAWSPEYGCMSCVYYFDTYKA